MIQRLSLLILGLSLASCTVVPDFRNLDPVTTPVVAPAPVTPAAPPPPPEVRLVSAIEAQGCFLTSDNVGSVLLAANMTQSELATTMGRLEELGRVQAASEGSIRVITERCV